MPSGYHQIKIAKEDRHKMTFAKKWGSYQYTVMPFRLKNAPTIFSRVVVEAFKEFLHKFLEAYFDDWTIFRLLQNHIECLRLMLNKCMQCQISLNLKKCILFHPLECFQAILCVSRGCWQIHPRFPLLLIYPLLLYLDSCALCWDIMDTTISSLKAMHILQHLWRIL